MTIRMKKGSKEYTCDEEGLEQWFKARDPLQKSIKPVYSERGGLTTLSFAGDNAVGNTKEFAIQRFFEHMEFSEKK